MTSSCEKSASTSDCAILQENKNGILHRNQLHSLFNVACLKSIYNDKMLCDVVLVAQGSEIHAHKLVLATCSPIFYWKFSDDRKLGQLNRIEMENIPFETLSTIVDYIYTSDIFITENNVEDLLAAARILVLKDLQQACHDFLKTNLNPSNCLQYREIANHFKCNELIPKFDNYIGTNLSEIVSRQEFLGLTYDQLTRIIRSDQLSTTEENVLECLLKWVRHDLEPRRHLFFRLAKGIRFPLIPQQAMLQRFEGEQWLKSDEQYNSFLGEVFKCYLLDGNKAPVAKPRQSLESRYLVVVGDMGQGLLSLEMYDLQQNIWIRWPEALTIKCQSFTPRVTIIGSCIYCIDGSNLISSQFFNPAEMKWVRLSENVDFENWKEVTSHGSKIYAMRYFEDIGLKRYIYELTMCDISNSFHRKSLPPLLDPSSCGSLGFLNGNLYIAGAKIQLYKPVINSWYLLPNMSIPRREAGVAAIGNMLYVIGGIHMHKCCSCNEVEVFNYEECCWTRLADMNVARSNPGVISINSQLYVVGGYLSAYGYSVYLKSVEVYDPVSNTWTMLANSMATGKTHVALGLIDRSDIITGKSMK